MLKPGRARQSNGVMARTCECTFSWYDGVCGFHGTYNGACAPSPQEDIGPMVVGKEIPRNARPLAELPEIDDPYRSDISLRFSLLELD